VLAREAALRERDGDLAELRGTVSTLQKNLSDRTLEIEHLKLWIAKLQRMQFGRKSEKIERQIEQLELRLEDLQTDNGAAAVASPKPRRAEGGKSTGRKPLPDHLPRQDIVHQPVEEACPQCGGALADLGEDVAEQLEYVPGHWRVIRHRRPKKACTCCDCIVQAALQAVLLIWWRCSQRMRRRFTNTSRSGRVATPSPPQHGRTHEQARTG
jgi:transposase